MRSGITFFGIVVGAVEFLEGELLGSVAGVGFAAGVLESLEDLNLLRNFLPVHEALSHYVLPQVCGRHHQRPQIAPVSPLSAFEEASTKGNFIKRIPSRWPKLLIILQH
eukprot:TRINITY_DN2688_c0_g4_i1.p1 TRINITY_DN2688_c0_g4~~TRINITY_DN2688_c0_g4_i1.p1  ORF type:complete len:109 (-),score=0.02 TRINITY_DN2688_c0_g4_i1:253-579(-)